MSLPSWFKEFRPGQEGAVNETVQGFDAGASVMYLDAPTGVGKTVIAEAVRQKLHKRRNLYACDSLTLMDQFTRDFPYAVQMKGRDNYPTMKYPEKFWETGWNRLSCADCTKTKLKPYCHWCEPVRDCTYERAKDKALKHDLVCTNTMYWMAECAHIGRFSGFDFVVVDEADLLEQDLMRVVEVRVSKKMQNRYGIGPPDKVTKVESWKEWFDKTYDVLDAAAVELAARESRGREDDRHAVELDRLVSSIERVGGLIDEEWVYTGENGDLTFKPIEPSAWGMDRIWRHGQKMLCMSATLISADMEAEGCGLTRPYRAVYMDSPFDPANGPVRFVNAGSGSKDDRGVSWPKWAAALVKLAELHPYDRMLVHTFSYAMTMELDKALVQAGMGDRVCTYIDSSMRKKTLESYFVKENGILLAASMERGLDLPDDLCRVQVVAGLPFPYLGDKQVSQRAYGTGLKGKRWYLGQTMRTFIQMCGRGVRHEGDWCHTYVLDSRAPTFVSRCEREGLVPKWWKKKIEPGKWGKMLGV